MTSHIEYLKEYREGNADALNNLLSLVQPDLLRYTSLVLNGRLSSRVSPEDILQNAYINICHKLNKRYHKHIDENNENSFIIFCRGQIKDAFVESYRRHHLAAKRSVTLEDDIFNINMEDEEGQFIDNEIPDSSPELKTPEHIVISSDQYKQIRNVLHELSPLYNNVIVERIFNHMSNQEYAKKYNMTEQLAAMRYIRGIRRLKRLVKDQ